MAKIATVHNAVAALKPKPEKRRPGLSSGSTLLNLACSERTDEAFYPGRVYQLVGDSSSGKSFLTLTCLAEANVNPAFEGYDLIYDDAENGAFFDFGKFFGPTLAGRVKAPRIVSGVNRYSEYLEDFYDALDDLYRAKRPFVYVLDSMDVLWPREDSKKYSDQKKVRRKNEAKGTEEKEGGSFGMAKAKRNSELLRVAVPKIRATGSILIIVSQAKTSMDAYGDGKTSAGGLALKFYSSLQMWSSVGGHIKRKVGIRERELGIKSVVRIKKNRQTGKDRRIMVPILHSVGLDDTGSMVEYLIEEGAWRKSGGKIFAKGLGYTERYEDLIQQIERNDDVQDLKTIVKATWDSIESSCQVLRKNRYGG